MYMKFVDYNYVKVAVAKIFVEICRDGDVLIDKHTIDRTGGFYTEYTARKIREVVSNAGGYLDVKMLRHAVLEEISKETWREVDVSIYKVYDILTGCLGLAVTYYDNIPLFE